MNVHSTMEDCRLLRNYLQWFTETKESIARADYGSNQRSVEDRVLALQASRQAASTQKHAIDQCVYESVPSRGMVQSEHTTAAPTPDPPAAAVYHQLQAVMKKHTACLDHAANIASLEDLIGLTCSSLDTTAANMVSTTPSAAEVIGKLVPRVLLTATDQNLAGKRGEWLDVDKTSSSLEDLIGLLGSGIDLTVAKVATTQPEEAVDAFCTPSHGAPASSLLEASISEEPPSALELLDSQWVWLKEVFSCLKIHLHNAAAYHQFWLEIKECSYWLNLHITNGYKSSSMRDGKPIKTRIKLLLIEVKDALKTYVHWQTRLDHLYETARVTVALPHRTEPSTHTLHGRAMLSYETAEVQFCEGECLTVLDNSGATMWHVRTAQGQEALVPSVIILIPPPDVSAIDAALRLRLQLLAIWKDSLKLFGRQIIDLLKLAFEEAVEEASRQTPAVACDYIMSEHHQSRLLALRDLISVALAPLWKDTSFYCDILETVTTLAFTTKASAKQQPITMERAQPFKQGQPIATMHGQPISSEQGANNTGRMVVIQLDQIEKLLQLYVDFSTYWDAYSTLTDALRQPKYISVYGQTDRIKYITTAHVIRFYDVALTQSSAPCYELKHCTPTASDTVIQASAAAEIAADATEIAAEVKETEKHCAANCEGPPRAKQLQDAYKTVVHEGHCLELIDKDWQHALCARGLIEIKRSTAYMRRSWLRLSLLLRCLDVHLHNASTYHQFWREVEECNSSINRMLVKVHFQLQSRTARADLDIQQLATMMDQGLQMFLQWQTRLDTLFQKTRFVIPLQYRAKFSLEASRGQAICAYETHEVSICDGERLTILNGGAAAKWRVRTAKGQEVVVPSVIVLIPPPDAAAMDAALRLRLQLLAIWTAYVKRAGRQVIELLRIKFEEAIGGASKIQILAAGKDGGCCSVTAEQLQRLSANGGLIVKTLGPLWEHTSSYASLIRIVNLLPLALASCAAAGTTSAADGSTSATAGTTSATADSTSATADSTSDAAAGSTTRGAALSGDGHYSTTFMIHLDPVDKLLQTYQDLCMYSNAYSQATETLRQPKYISLYGRSDRMKYITTAHFVRFYEAILSTQSGEAKDGGSFESVETVTTSTSAPLANDEAVLPRQSYDATDDGSFESVETVTTSTYAPLANAEAVVSTESDEAADEGCFESLETVTISTSAPLANDEAVLPRQSYEATDEGSFESVETETETVTTSTYAPLANDVVVSTQSDEATEEDSFESVETVTTSTSAPLANEPVCKKTIFSAALEETETEVEEVGHLDKDTIEHGDFEEVSYFESSTKEQQSSTEGVMEAEMEVTTTFVITGIVHHAGDPNGEVILSFQDAIDIGILDPQRNAYVMKSGASVVTLTIGEAMEAGYIKMGPKVEKKSVEKIKSAAIITVKTTAERCPYIVQQVKDTRTGIMLSHDEGVAAGILNLSKHTYRDLVSNEVMLIGDAVEQKLVEVEYDKNTSGGTVHEEVCKTYTVHSVYDVLRNERVEFHVAVQRGIIDEKTGAYANKATGERLFATEAIDRGLIQAVLTE